VLSVTKSPPVLPAELWTLDQLAAYLHRRPSAIYGQRYRRRAPGNLGIEAAGRVLFDPEVIARWLAAGGRADWTPNGAGE
jgi:hypothetical protein